MNIVGLTSICNENIIVWVDALRFDYDLIVGVYESNKTDEWISDSLSEDVREGVYNRMEEEKQEALAMFTKEIQ